MVASEPFQQPFHQPQVVHRQSGLMPTLFSGPLALAAFLFTLPLIPSLVMAPLAVAGLPSAFNVFTSVVSGLTNGRPLQSFILPFTDPLYNLGVSTSENQTDILNANQPIRRQLNMLRTFAKTFAKTVVMSKRYSVNPVKSKPNEKPNTVNLENENNNVDPTNDIIEQEQQQTQETSSPPSAPVPEKVDSEFENLMISNNHAPSNKNSSIDDILTLAANNIGDKQMEKSIRGMDLLYSSLRDIYAVIRNGLRRYEITDSACQSRIVCEIHQKIISRNKLLKTFSLNALDVLNLEKHVDSWNSLNQKSKETIKFYINAAKIGFADKDCNKEFRTCPTLNTRSLRNMLLSRSNALTLLRLLSEIPI